MGFFSPEKRKRGATFQAAGAAAPLGRQQCALCAHSHVCAGLVAFEPACAEGRERGVMYLSREGSRLVDLDVCEQEEEIRGAQDREVRTYRCRRQSRADFRSIVEQLMCWYHVLRQGTCAQEKGGDHHNNGHVAGVHTIGGKQKHT